MVKTHYQGCENKPQILNILFIIYKKMLIFLNF
nr:MAG TPA: hypothetical protein [Caudoviricetes sp.]